MTVGRPLRFYGAAVSLSRRRSLRRGTPGHDGIPRALGIMRPHHRTHPAAVTTRKKAWFLRNQGFFVYPAKAESKFGHDLVTSAMVKSYR